MPAAGAQVQVRRASVCHCWLDQHATLVTPQTLLNAAFCNAGCSGHSTDVLKDVATGKCTVKCTSTDVPCRQKVFLSFFFYLFLSGGVLGLLEDVSPVMFARRVLPALFFKGLSACRKPDFQLPANKFETGTRVEHRSSSITFM